MAVVGNTTAALATVSYSPPFQPYTSTAPITWIGYTPSATGGAATPVNTAPNPVNPTVPALADDHAYVAAYLQIHGLSSASYRYAYILWFVLVALAIIYTIFHHLHLENTALGSLWTRIFIKRTVWRNGKQGMKNAASPNDLVNGHAGYQPAVGKGLAKKKPRPWVLPSRAQVLSIAVVGVLSAALCVVGDDYISTSTSTWDFSTSFTKRNAIPQSLLSVLDKRAGGVSRYSTPNYNIPKTWWTSGSRFGLIAFALFPLVVLFALKAPPFAILAIRGFTHLHADKLMLIHRWTGRIIWLFTALHVALWTVELLKDPRGDGSGKSVWMIVWIYSKFIWGVVGFAGMTGLIVLSFKSIRKRMYEFFYIAHVLLTLVTLLGSVLHYPPLWYWIAVAAGLWALERIHRFVRFARINGIFGGVEKVVPAFAAGPKFGSYGEGTWNSDMGEYNMQEFHPTGYGDKSLPPDPRFNQYSEAAGMSRSATEDRLTHYSALSGHSAQGSNEQTLYDGTSTPLPSRSLAPGGRRTLNIPAGYAHAQLLPSKTVRLTVRLPKPFAWAPGQHVLLYIPEISRWQSHPFSILSVYNENGNQDIVLLVKARKGLTRKLFDLTRRKVFQAAGVEAEKGKRYSLQSVRSLANREPPNVLYRVMLDGPFGSSARGRPGQHSTIIIVCGGSGVSFGISLLQYLCECMAAGGGKAGRRFVTRRVRFVWVVREFAEIAWISVMLKRCIDMVPKDSLQIDIFVTDVTSTLTQPNMESMYSNAGADDFAPPQPSFYGASHSRRPSASSISSDLSKDGVSSDLPYLDTQPVGEDMDNHDIIDLTNYEDEEEVEQSEAQIQLSKKVLKAGKVRRARSRRAHRRQPSSVTKPSYPPQTASYYDPSRPQTPSMPLQQQIDAYRSGQRTPQSAAAAVELAYAAPLPQRLDSSYSLEAPSPFGHNSRPSMSSLVDGYDRYDPFGSADRSGQFSPSPSMHTFDMGGDTRSIAGDSLAPFAPKALGSRADSMVLIGNSSFSDGTGDAGIWLDAADYLSMNVVAEMTRPGRPKLDVILQEEIDRASGTIGVGTCGPPSLNAMVRNTVASHIATGAALRGDRRGVIALFSEDYDA